MDDRWGENLVQARRRQDITVDEYIRFFGKKWEKIAIQLGLVYTQRVEGDGVHIAVEEH